jgi:predicted ATPase
VIRGFSGCGKTRLVESVYEAIDAAGGYIICQKFDGAVPAALSPLSVVISAFNDLCLLIAKRSTMEELHNIHQRLLDEFGANFHALARLLPNVISMIASFDTPISNTTSNISNCTSLCYTIQRFMRVISCSRPVFFFLDDLQW